jgi:anti-anti-sigma factor
MDADATAERRTNSPALTLTMITTAAGHTLLTVVGDLDAATVDEFANEVDEQPDQPLDAAMIIDLSGVSFCAASAVNVLLRVTAEARRRRLPIAIVASQHAVTRPVELLSLETVLPLYDSLAEAQQWLERLPHLPKPRDGHAGPRQPAV